MLYGIIGILTIIIIFLIIKLQQKIKYDTEKIQKINNNANKTISDLEKLLIQKQKLSNEIREDSALLSEYQTKLLEVQSLYKEELNKKVSDLNQYFENQKQLRQSEMDDDFIRQETERKESLNLRMKEMTRQAQEQVNKAEAEARAEIERWKKAQEDIAKETFFQEERYEGLLAPLSQYEKEQQEKLYYTIQVPEEYKADINFLLTTVAEKIQHPDVINKLIWTEYVKPYIDDTFKRVGIEDKPGIYKLTSLLNGKCYIGKSTNMKKRISDHIKSVVGITTIANQTVHQIIAREGYWNWTIEPIIYCEKDKLNELEKYYIDFFKSQTYGYNKNVGGGG